MDKSNNDFIREYRKKLNLTQLEFAEKFCISVYTLRLWEQGRSIAPDYLVMLLKERETYAEALNAMKSAMRYGLSQITQAVTELDDIDPQSFLDKPKEATSSYCPGQMTLFDFPKGLINVFTGKPATGGETEEDASSDASQEMSTVTYDTSEDIQAALAAEETVEYGKKEEDT